MSDDEPTILYEVREGAAWITINRPKRMNAFNAPTVNALVEAFQKAWVDKSVGCVCLTGAGDRAFCAGGDQKQKLETGDYGEGDGLFRPEELHRVIRDIPKPVIAVVNGFAIGGGHVLHLICDLSIAAETAKFGQTGPRVGSYDAGFGTGLLARAIGEKRAREIWFLCRQYSAQQALEWGLVNAVVPADQLHAEAAQWASEINMLSPTALKMLKQSLNADTEHLAGLAAMANSSLMMFSGGEESKEGVAAFNEKRAPDFSPFR